jgi:hypothetical protein
MNYKKGTLDHAFFMTELLTLCAEYDYEPTWDVDLKFFINCIDDFYDPFSKIGFPTTRIEVSDLTDIVQLRKAFRAAKEDGPLLYCARKLKRRPCPESYGRVEKKRRHYFKHCGPNIWEK